MGITWRNISAWRKDRRVVKIPNSFHGMFWAASTYGTGIREENHILSATSGAWSIKKLPDTFRLPARRLLTWLVYDGQLQGQILHSHLGMWYVDTSACNIQQLTPSPSQWLPRAFMTNHETHTHTPQWEMVEHLSMKGGRSLCDKRAVILKQEGLMRKDTSLGWTFHAKGSCSISGGWL